MAKKIKINQLSKEINSILQSYTDEVIDVTKEVVDEVTSEALKEVKSHAPVGYRKGKYKKSLKKKTIYESLTEKRNVVYASNGEHRLTHLLEKGHARISGGRTKATPHFYYGDMLIKEELPKKLKKRIGGK